MSRLWRTGCLLVFVWMVLSVMGCSNAPTQPDDEQAALPPLSDGAWLEDASLDGVFIVPGTDFRPYTGLMVPNLDLSQWRPAEQELPLRGLNRNDREFIQATYSRTLVHTLVMEGEYSLAMNPGPEVLEVRANLRQGVQAAEDRRNSLQPRGTVMMLLTLDLYDAQSGELVGTMSQRQPIDRSLSERNSPVTAVQIQNAFAHWMNWFHTELNALRASP